MSFNPYVAGIVFPVILWSSAGVIPSGCAPPFVAYDKTSLAPIQFVKNVGFLVIASPKTVAEGDVACLA